MGVPSPVQRPGRRTSRDVAAECVPPLTRELGPGGTESPTAAWSGGTWAGDTGHRGGPARRVAQPTRHSRGRVTGPDQVAGPSRIRPLGIRPSGIRCGVMVVTGGRSGSGGPVQVVAPAAAELGSDAGAEIAAGPVRLGAQVGRAQGDPPASTWRTVSRGAGVEPDDHRHEVADRTRRRPDTDRDHRRDRSWRTGPRGGRERGGGTRHPGGADAHRAPAAGKGRVAGARPPPRRVRVARSPLTKATTACRASRPAVGDRFAGAVPGRERDNPEPIGREVGRGRPVTATPSAGRPPARRTPVSPVAVRARAELEDVGEHGDLDSVRDRPAASRHHEVGVLGDTRGNRDRPPQVGAGHAVLTESLSPRRLVLTDGEVLAQERHRHRHHPGIVSWAARRGAGLPSVAGRPRPPSGARPGPCLTPPLGARPGNRLASPHGHLRTRRPPTGSGRRWAAGALGERRPR